MITEKLNKIFDPHFWDCSKFVTVSTAKNAEGIAQDVKKAEKPRISLNEKYTQIKQMDLKLTQKTIPNYILVFTGAGVVCEGVACVIGVPWFIPVVFFCGIIVSFVLKFQEMRAEECY
jgi:Flp pilus assembly protein TadB